MSQEPFRAEPVEALRLSFHPTTPAPEGATLSISLARTPDGLWLRYHLEIPEETLALPEPAQPTRADNLWRTTCFELFLRRPGAADYAEFNFSPSSRWAAYRFDDVRAGMTELDLPKPPEIGMDASDGHFALEARLTLPPEWCDCPLEAALAAVVETTDGAKSYWALAHPAEQPDFHHPGGFVVELP